MKKFVTCALALSLSIPAISTALAQPNQIPPVQVPPAQRPSPQGFGTLLCLADALLGGAALPGDPIVLFGGQVVIDDISTLQSSNGLLAIDVRITHGTSFSDHTVTFIDANSSGTLNCGDTIVSVL